MRSFFISLMPINVLICRRMKIHSVFVIFNHFQSKYYVRRENVISKYFAYQSRGKKQLKTVNTALYTQIQATGERNTRNEKRLQPKEAKQKLSPW